MDKKHKKENKADHLSHPVTSQKQGTGRNPRIWILPAVIVAICVVGLAVWFLFFDRVYSRTQAEAGSVITVADFMKRNYTGEIVKEKSDVIDTAVPGEYKLAIKSGILTYPVTLTIVDTVAPMATGVDRMVSPGETLTAEDFLADVSDATKLTIGFDKQPDFQTVHEERVGIVITDLGNNTTYVEALLQVVPVKGEVVCEAGDPMPEAKAFAVEEGQEITYASETSVSMNTPGNYPVYLKTGGEAYTSHLKVEDTVAPVIAGKEDFAIYIGAEPKPEYFVEKVEDATEVTLALDGDAPTDAAGSYKAHVIATDAAGNTAEAEIPYQVKKDTEAPVIDGLHTVHVVVGNSVSYKKGITVTDDLDPEPLLEADSSQVDLNTVGRYPITYKATDASGNTTEAEAEVNVKEPTEATEENIDRLAEEVLSQILKEGMSEYDKAKAIFNWVHSIGYVDQSNHDDPLEAAYDGLYRRRGDCYTYAITSQVLLTHAGITNILVEKIPTKRRHFWNIIDIGEGWHHFDACRRSDGSTFFYVDNATLMEYSNKHYNSHNYDVTKYPVVP